MKIKKFFSQLISENYKKKERINKSPYSKDINNYSKHLLMNIENRANIIDRMRELYFTNPLAKNHARFYASKVFGQNFKINSPHIEISSSLNKAFKSIKNIKALAEWLIVDGDIFLYIKKNMDNGDIKTKYIKSEEIIDIIYDNNDDPLYYIKEYYDQTTNSIIKETIEASEIVHISINKTPYSKFGLSDLYASYSWIKTHENVVMAAAKKVELENAFAWHISMNNATKEDIEDRVNIYNTKGFKDSLKEGGGIIISNSKEEWKTLSRNNSSNVDDTALRETKLMAIAGSALPEFIITGDAKNANLSSAQAQDMPFAIIVRNYQDTWRNALLEYFKKVLEIEKKYLLISNYVLEKKTILKSDRKQYELMYNIKNIYSQKNKEYEIIEYTVDIENADFDIIFPDILSSDDKLEVDVLKAELDMGIISKQTAALKRGYDYKNESLLNMENQTI